MQALQREQTPGTNASRDVVSCRIVSVCPSAPKITSWCASRPGRRTEWIGTSPPHPARGLARGARRRIELLRVVELDDLRVRQHLRRLGGEAHHQHRADREVRCVEEWSRCSTARSCERLDVGAGRADDARHACSSARATLTATASGYVKSIAASWPVEVDLLPTPDRRHLVPRLGERGREHRARRGPLAPKSATFTPRRARAGPDGAVRARAGSAPRSDRSRPRTAARARAGPTRARRPARARPRRSRR